MIESTGIKMPIESKYGFTVWYLYTWKQLLIKSLSLIAIFNYVIPILLILLLWEIINTEILLMIFLFVYSYWIIELIRIFWGFIIWRRIFYTEHHVIFWWEKFKQLSYREIKNHLSQFYLKPLKEKTDNLSSHKKDLDSRMIISVAIIFIILFWQSLVNLIGNIFIELSDNGYGWALWLAGYFNFSIFVSLIVASITYTFTNPLYVFSNLWSHIQSLTPMIEEKSREIEANFREDMDFGKLRSGFSDLSASLAKVSEYIVKLEQAEKKANKWNLFDSVKYINSLKWDIVKPLVALRSFLSTRLTELEQSKGEMQKVRVKAWWWEEALTLQSARTEPLMIELRGNIEKLDVMIGKME